MSELTDPIDQLEDNETNLEKYKCVGQIATKIMNKIVKLSKPNKKVKEIIDQGYLEITNELNNVYPEIKNKGIAFPICLSLNNIAGHYCLATDILKEGDLLKIEFGIHIDGFPTTIAFTTLITNNTKIAKDDKRANVMKAAIKASREVAKKMKPGVLNTEIVKIIEEAAKEFNCTLPTCSESGIIPGILSYQMSQNIIDFDANKDDELEYIHRFIMPKQNPTYDFALQELPLEENEVYAIDIVMCSGQGKLVKSNDTCIFKRNYDKHAELKLKASRNVLNSVKSKYPVIVDCQDLNNKMGLKECLSKEILQSYPVVCEKTGEFIARIKFTIIVKDKPILLCGKQADSELSKCE